MTKTKFILSGLMIFFIVLATASFIFPFYRADISGLLGDTRVDGSLIATGIGFLFGLQAITTGYFETKFNASNPLYVRPNTLYLVVGILVIILLALAILLICLKRKDSVLYHILNLGVGISGVVLMFITIFSLNISNTGLLGELEGYETLLQTEGLSYGSILLAVCLGFYGFIGIAITVISFVTYRVMMNNSRRRTYAGPLIEQEKKPALGYGASKLLENKFMGKLIGFFKKDDENEETPMIEEQNNEETPTQEVKEEPHKEKTLQEKLADIERMRANGQISDEDYKKYRQAIVDKHYNSKYKN